MSKSLGNVDRSRRTSSRRAAPTSSACGWRWSTTATKCALGKQILARVVEAYRKIRNTLPVSPGEPVRLRSGGGSRAASRGLHGGRSLRAGALRATSPRAVLRRLRAYDFPTIFQRVNHLATVDLSAFYADVSKDRLYTFAAGSPERRSAQTAMYTIADGLVRLLAPILPMTADELWRHLPGTREASVHLAEFPRRPKSMRWSTPGSTAGGSGCRASATQVNAALEDGAQGQDHRHVARRRRSRLTRRRRRRARLLREPSMPSCRCSSSCRRSRSTPAQPPAHRWRWSSRARSARSARAAGGSSTGSRRTPVPSGICASLRRRARDRGDGIERHSREPPSFRTGRRAGPVRGTPRAPLRPARADRIAAVVGADQLTKASSARTLDALRPIPVIPGFLDITHVQNTGAAFGLLNAADFRYKAVVMIGIAASRSWRSPPTRRQLGFHERLARFGLSLILGGAFGNLIDRAVAGYVVDFVDVYWGDAHFWAFNVADAAITVGAILVLLDMIGLGRQHASHPV